MVDVGLLEDLEPTNAYGNTEWTGQSAMGLNLGTKCGAPADGSSIVNDKQRQIHA